MLQGVEDRGLGDFGEHHPLDGDFRLQQVGEVPANAFAFAVFVCRQNEFVGPLERSFQFRDRFLFLGGHQVERGEVLFDIHAEGRPAHRFHLGGDISGLLRQVANVPHAGQDLVIAAEEAANLLGLGG